MSPTYIYLIFILPYLASYLIVRYVNISIPQFNLNPEISSNSFSYFVSAIGSGLKIIIGVQRKQRFLTIWANLIWPKYISTVKYLLLQRSVPRRFAFITYFVILLIFIIDRGARIRVIYLRRRSHMLLLNELKFVIRVVKMLKHVGLTIRFL